MYNSKLIEADDILIVLSNDKCLQDLSFEKTLDVSAPTNLKNASDIIYLTDGSLKLLSINGTPKVSLKNLILAI